ncbi:quinone-dependent dihydroorotate dehydrogenase [Salinisphaera sp. Q1T1-3]|uniref:quinone-dependent dihydroorotate dehydrogenase n=1 Tax=Salinisphaera sp. Q1T1-3 TaxID=2321229 RepID=UPI000E7170A8|nr:quinone-dependent dihydroorotate dehydrogenase [Salinisphaera sp. Q1T1-3]RJS95038.1 quinone-dependent dihydroorotate dehydrogenase [Salinisphaera sp. Q1T1-3]
MYSLLRPALFSLDAERAHDLSLAAASRAAPWLAGVYGRRVPNTPTTLMGLRLPNPVGLAAGLDKNGAHVDGLAAMGFGFLEVGTVTPRPQSGNSRPRLFRLPEARGILNRFGFNNAGVAALTENVATARFRGVLGINIGKNKETPPADAVADYTAALAAVYDHAHYVTINVSSPNTAGLRDWQGGDALDDLLSTVVAERDRLAEIRRRRVPLALKIAPDLDEAGIAAIVERLRHYRLDGVIATNTTTSREGLAPRWRAEAGGVSGRPVRDVSTRVIAMLHARLGEEIPIIGVGGILHGGDAAAKIAAGATAVQLYSGLIYRGPALVAESVRAISARRAPAVP